MPPVPVRRSGSSRRVIKKQNGGIRGFQGLRRLLNRSGKKSNGALTPAMAKLLQEELSKQAEDAGKPRLLLVGAMLGEGARSGGGGGFGCLPRPFGGRVRPLHGTDDVLMDKLSGEGIAVVPVDANRSVQALFQGHPPRAVVSVTRALLSPHAACPPGGGCMCSAWQKMKDLRDQGVVLCAAVMEGVREGAAGGRWESLFSSDEVEHKVDLRGGDWEGGVAAIKAQFGFADVDPNLAGLGAESDDASGRSEAIIRMAFDVIDTDGSGAIDQSELMAGFRRIGVEVEEEQAAALIKKCDSNGDGVIDFEEFKEKLGPLMGLY